MLRLVTCHLVRPSAERRFKRLKLYSIVSGSPIFDELPDLYPPSTLHQMQPQCPCPVRTIVFALTNMTDNAPLLGPSGKGHAMAHLSPANDASTMELDILNHGIGAGLA